MSDFSKIVASYSKETRITLIRRCKDRNTVIPTGGPRMRATQIDRLNGFDPEAWKAFYTPYRDFALWIAKNINQKKHFGLTDAECEEIAQNVMERVIESIRDFDPDMPSRRHSGRVKFRSWFYSQVFSEIGYFKREDHYKLFKRDFENSEKNVENATEEECELDNVPARRRHPENFEDAADEDRGSENAPTEDVGDTAEEECESNGLSAEYYPEEAKYAAKEILDDICIDPATDAELDKFDEKFHRERAEAIKAKALELLAQSRIKPRNIEAFQMFMNGRPVAEITKETGLTENSVHQAVSRCRRFIAKRHRELEKKL